jgi:predicted deacylase
MTVALHTRSFAGPTPGPHLLVTGGVHGDEFEPVVAIRRLIDRLAHEPGLVSSLRGRVTLVPVVNEGAFRRGSRVADDGLDLARTCPGRADGSVTERTAAALAALIRTADFYVDLHTGGTRLDVLPLVGYVLHPDPAILDTQRRMARAFGLPVVWGTTPCLEGRSLSVARDAGVPAIYAEYRGAATCRPDGVAAYVAGCLAVMAACGLVDRAAPAVAITHMVEDDRPGSGHLQVCHPSPVAGCFVPAVALGAPVHAGDRLGTVLDPVGATETAIHAEQSGIVLVLRSFPQVDAGESLCVILETG